jgi:hypothetical protein
MSDLFTRLAERALRRGPAGLRSGLQPSEPLDGDEQEEEIVVDVAPTSTAEPPARAAAQATPEPAGERTVVLVTPAQTPPEEPAPTRAAPHPEPPATEPGRGDRAGRSVVPEPAVHAAPEMPAPATARAHEPAAPITPHASVAPPARDDETARLRLTPAELPRFDGPSAGAAARGEPQPALPPVEVTIGRIEVRVRPPVVSRPAPAVPALAPEPALSLQEYLRRREASS